MRTRLSKEQAASVRKFEELMTFPPDPLVIRCARCKRLRETTEISDPMLVVQPFACIELGSSCDLGETLRSNVKPTEPHYLPGSFVIATKDENHYVPGMIDYIPERHPEFESYKESPFGDERLLEGYHVSLLSNPDQDYASDWYFLHQISPLERKHNLIMPDSEALAKFETCLAMERSDLRRRLYRFSYMARTYQLKCTLPPEPRRIPIKHGAFVDPGPPVKEVFVNIVPDLSEEGNVEVTRFAATLAGAVAGTAEGEKRLSDIQRSTGYEALYLDKEDSPAPPEGY